MYGGGKNEKEDIASLDIAFDRLSLRRMRNDSRHGGRYTEHRESREKDSFWRIGRNLNAGVAPLSFWKLSGESKDALLMKAEHNQSCGLPFTDTRKNSPRLFQSKKVPAE